jgi:hypothetical protein
MQRALSQFVVQGIHTSIPLHQKIFADAEFRAGKFDTKFMERFFEREGHKRDAAVEDHFSPNEPIRTSGKTPRMIPRLYAIVDAEVLARRGVALRSFARELRAAGVRLVQYRDKVGSPQEVLRAASVLREAFARSACRLIMNDRADLAVLAWIRWRACGPGGSVARGCPRASWRRERALGHQISAVELSGSRRIRTSRCARRLELRGLCRDWAGVCHRHQGGCGAGGGAEWSAAGARADDEAAGRHRRNHAGECAQRDRCRSGFGRGDLGLFGNRARASRRLHGTFLSFCGRTEGT